MNWSSWLGRCSRRRWLRVFAAALVAGLVVAGMAAATDSRSQTAPSNGSLPAISGSTTVGSTVTANPGTWNGSAPITFQYQWLTCDGSGNACHDIAGATAQSYQVTSGDTGNTLRLLVIGSNSDGSSSATSDSSAKIAAASGPANTSPPTISGSAAAGATVTANPGTWTGVTPITYKYQWLICDGSGNACHDIAGATAQSYQIAGGDTGNTVRVSATATNSDGSSTSTSVPTATIAVASAQTGCPKLAAGLQAVSVADVASPARLQVDQFVLISGPITGRMASFMVRFHIADTCGQAVSGAAVYATAVPYEQVTIPAELATDATGWVTLVFNRLGGFPASRKQQLMVLFVRARRPGDPLLAGVSTRRLIALPLNLGG